MSAADAPEKIWIFETGFHDGNGNSEAILFDEPGDKRECYVPLSALHAAQEEIRKLKLNVSEWKQEACELDDNFKEVEAKLESELASLKDRHERLREAVQAYIDNGDIGVVTLEKALSKDGGGK